MIIGISGKINSGKDLTGKIIQILTSFPNMSTGRILEHIDKDLANNVFEIKKFADALKDMVCLLIGGTREQLEDKEFKEKPLGEEWIRYGYADGFTTDNNGNKTMIFKECDKERYEIELRINWQTAYKIHYTPRMLLQAIGTDLFRNQLLDNIWVNALMNNYIEDVKTNFYGSPSRIDTYKNWIITDVRFENEAKAIKDKGGITIRVNRDTEYLKCLKNPVYFVENYIRTNKEKKLELREFDKEFIRKHCKPMNEHSSETALDNTEFDYVIDNNGTIEELIEKVREVLIKESIICYKGFKDK